MKISITCGYCAHLSEPGAHLVAYELQVINDSGCYEFECPHGHRTVTILQQVKFEILFEIGVYAIKDGYYREAITSFSASLERFYEFFIKAICLSRDLNQEEITNAWNTMAKQSERQLGAFIAIHLLELGSHPQLLSNKMVELRNEVVHKGKIPSKEEAIKYGQAVLDLVRPLIVMLKEKHSQSISILTAEHLSNARKSKKELDYLSTLCQPTILSLLFISETRINRPLEKIIEEYRN
ncbi:hypothetical protein KTI95_04385 [Acinetobacter baumannii]|nr:hypothetical protein [Acinetobacter baumannii]